MAYEFELADLEWLSAHGTRVVLEAGEAVFREGDPGDALYVVLRGNLHILGANTLYETVQPGGLVGEMAVVNEAYPRSASVVAATRAELLRIDGPTLLSLIASKPSFALTLMRVSTRRLRTMNRRYLGPSLGLPEADPILSSVPG